MATSMIRHVRCPHGRVSVLHLAAIDLQNVLQSDISTLLLLTPDETNASFANFEFDDPVPSKL